VPGDHVSTAMIAMLVLCAALMAVNYLDRQVVVSVFPWLKAHWRLTDLELGALVSIVAIAIAMGTVPLSYLTDRWGRARSMAVMAIAWSSATVACAFAVDYVELLAARAVVGLAEAAYGTAGAALLGSMFPARRRSLVIATFIGASILGSAAGLALGGTIAQAWGWRMSFALAGIPGLVLGGVLLLAGPRLADAVAHECSEAPPGFVRSIGTIARTPVVLLACLGGGLQLCTAAAVLAWLPAYLHRVHGLPPAEAGRWAGAANLMGLVGILAWAALSDALAPRLRAAHLLVPAMAGLMTFSLFAVAFGVLAPGRWQLAFIAAGAAAMIGTVGPLAAVVFEVVDSRLRATATSLLALAQNLAGLAAGPLIVGGLADRVGLPAALGTVPWFSAAAAMLFMIGAWVHASRQQAVFLPP
jgi:MFS family permease